MRSLVLGCVADDYTGASDLANTLTKSGLRTVQTVGVPSSDLCLPDVDAIVVALKIRSIAAGDAVARAREATRWLRMRGASHVMFKICSTFDSTNAGNIGPVTDALREDAGQSIALVTPAFPATGRSVYQGHLFVGAAPLNESPLKDHPLNPMRDANLVRVLSRQSAAPVGLVAIDAVTQGPDAVCERLQALAANGCRSAIADAVFATDLDILGNATAGQAFSVGASGLGMGLAHAMVARASVPNRNAVPKAVQPVGGLAACLAGSCSQATRQQVQNAKAHMPVLMIDVSHLLDGGDEIGRALQFCDEHLASGPVLIATSAAPEDVGTLHAQHEPETLGRTIEAALSSIATGLVTRGVRRFVVAGGETSGAIVDGLTLPAFLIGPEIAAGVPVLRTVATSEPMLLALKSGNFGGPDFFNRALDLMK